MAKPEQPETYSLRSAEAADASRVAELVDAPTGTTSSASGCYLAR